jgi:hypothetical protein
MQCRIPSGWRTLYDFDDTSHIPKKTNKKLDFSSNIYSYAVHSPHNTAESRNWAAGST